MRDGRRRGWRGSRKRGIESEAMVCGGCDAGTCELEDAEVRRWKMKMVGKSLAVPMRLRVLNYATINLGLLTHRSAVILSVICQHDLGSQWVMLKICFKSFAYLEP